MKKVLYILIFVISSGCSTPKFYSEIRASQLDEASIDSAMGSVASIPTNSLKWYLCNKTSCSKAIVFRSQSLSKRYISNLDLG